MPRFFYSFSLSAPQTCEKWNISYHISKQRMSQTSALAALQCELAGPEELRICKYRMQAPES